MLDAPDKLWLPKRKHKVPFCRPDLIEIPGTHRHPRDPGGHRGPKGIQGDPKGPKGTQRDPRGPKVDPRGPKGAFSALWGNGPMGPFGVIPKPFRMESNFEWKVITNGKTFRNLEFAEVTTNCSNFHCKATCKGSDGFGLLREALAPEPFKGTSLACGRHFRTVCHDLPVKGNLRAVRLKAV